MKVKVTFFIGGRCWDEVYEVNNLADAKIPAVSRNPTAKVIAMNPIF